jgi:hypothetical protein
LVRSFNLSGIVNRAFIMRCRGIYGAALKLDPAAQGVTGVVKRLGAAP